MTIGEWLTTRTPAPPPALMTRVRNLLGDAVNEDVQVAAERCLETAEATVQGLLRAGRTGRESAADLLAADALVTYAAEAAAGDPASIVDWARSAMIRLAKVGANHSGSTSGAGMLNPD